ncbi:MAG TPA: hypothetical protein VNJ46_04850 [Gaiellaceae bacterium]|nr:hypothetical protein [Gaiellaceae bacterium]
MHIFERRLQILLDERRYARLAAHARERNVSVGAVVREAIDRLLPATSAERSSAARRILGAEPMPVPDPAALREELDELRSRRA